MILPSQSHWPFPYKEFHSGRNMRAQYAELFAKYCVEYSEKGGVRFEYPDRSTSISPQYCLS